MHSIQVKDTKMSFSSAHFVLGADYCEALHGHNYAVEITVLGFLDPKGMVMDFRSVKTESVRVCKELDHKVLLPGNSSEVKIIESANELEVSIQGKRYVFPKDDCLVLPISATTAELLAEYIARQLKTVEDHRLKVCVSENVGTKGCFETE